MSAREIYWRRNGVSVKASAEKTWITDFEFFAYGRRIVHIDAQISSEGVSQAYADKIAEAIVDGLNAAVRKSDV